MSRGLAAIVAGLFFVVSATVVSAEEIDRHFEKSFGVEQGARLVLTHGDITMRGCSGSFDVRTSDGNFRAELLAAGRIRAESGDGDMTLGLTGGEDLDLEVRTGDGSVEIDHDATLSASFEIETRDGGIRIDAPAAVTVNRGRHRASGSVGEGEGWIRVTTGDGHVTLRAGD